MLVLSRKITRLSDNDLCTKLIYRFIFCFISMEQNVPNPEGDYTCHISNDAGETNHKDAESFQLLRQRKL